METNERKKKVTAAGVMTAISLLFVFAGALIKIIQVPKVVQDFATLGVGELTVLLGFAELVFGTLFYFTRTMKLGFVLLSSYLGGAMAVHVSHGNSPLQPAFLLIIIWITAYLRDRSVFINL